MSATSNDWRYVVAQNWRDEGSDLGERESVLTKEGDEHMTEPGRSTTLCGIELTKLGDKYASSMTQDRTRKRCAKCIEAYKVHPRSEYAKWMASIAATTRT